MSASAKILVYDGDCRMCTSFSRLADRRWLVGDATRRPVDSFEGEDRVRLHEAGVHNEMAVIEEASGEIRTGYDGILWLMESGRLRWLAPFFRRGPLASLGRSDYRTLAYNRRILSPPARGMACACDPDLHVGYRWNFIALCLAWMLLIGVASAFTFLDRAWWLGLGLPPAWLLVTLGARFCPAAKRLDYRGHTAFVGTLMTLPAAMAGVIYVVLALLWAVGLAPAALAHPTAIAIPLLAAAWALALPLALRSLLGRLPRLGLPRWAAVVGALVYWLVPLGVGFALGALM
jgi:predicted DCC family thiol-disulfide oxidoreductase YuxK